ncbi:MAG: hypothetical protein RL619_2088, partial [Bacteroidota bacterium]
LTFILESTLFLKKESSKIIFYDTVDFVKQDQKKELIEDLKNRTGLEIHRVTIDSIDFLKDSCTLTIYYYEN